MIAIAGNVDKVVLLMAFLTSRGIARFVPQEKAAI